MEQEYYIKFFDNPKYFISNHGNVKHRNTKVLKKIYKDGQYWIKIKYPFDKKDTKPALMKLDLLYNYYFKKNNI